MATVCCARPLYDYDSDEAVRARSLSRLVLPRGRENLNILLSFERERELENFLREDKIIIRDTRYVSHIAR